MISDDDWKAIKPKEIDQLGRKRFRNPDEARKLDLFQTMDLRVEWACSRLVIVNNLLILLCALFLLINGTQLYALYVQFWPK